MEFSKPPGSAFSAPRRVFTAPTHPTSQNNASSSRSTDGSVDTLYDHPSVKIIAFNAGTRPLSISPRTDISSQDVEPGTLSWSSQLERTIAVGPFRIYRAPGSVAFLSCGSALQPILPKSQVWSVDESSSKFVLQIRRPQYWRIELPVADSEDVRRAHLLREVFDNILQFEKTECPFRRSFTVELPEPPQTPVKKRPWTPVRKPRPSLPLTPVTPAEIPRFPKLASKEAFSPVLGSSVLSPGSEVGATDTVGSSRAPSECPEAEEEEREGSGDEVLTTRDEDVEREIETQPGDASPAIPAAEGPQHSNVARLSSFYTSRCFTAPPQLMMSQTKEEPPEPLGEEAGPQSPEESQDSFHSTQSFHPTPLPPSPPSSNPASPIGSSSLPKTAAKLEDSIDQEDTSDMTVISNASQPWSTSPTASVPSESSDCVTALSSVCDDACSSPTCSATTPEAAAEPAPPLPSPTFSLPAEESLTTSASTLSLSSLSSLSRSSSVTATRRPQIRHRATTSSSISPSRRALSPLPPAANLFSPRQNFAATHAAVGSKLAAVRRLPMAVIQATCEILMSPPSHLLNLMLRVAARIAAGEWRGLMFGTDDQGEQIPVQWDWSDEEDGNNNNSNTGSSGGRWCEDRRVFIDDDWPPKTGRKMAGSFPDSDDDEDSVVAFGGPGVGGGEADALGGAVDGVDGRDGCGDKGGDPAEERGNGESDWSRSLGVD